MKATIRQVAELAGVSITTVSHVLNNKEGMRVRQETQRRVVDAARKLNYHSGGHARVQVPRRTGNLGLLYPGAMTANCFDCRNFTGSVSAVCRSAADLGYGLMLEPSMSSEDDLILLPTFVRDGKVDGLLVMGLETEAINRLLSLTGKTVPIVSIDKEHSDTDCVIRDNFRGAVTATNHLLAKGCSSIVCLCPSFDGHTPSHSICSERLDGFVLALARAGTADAVSVAHMITDAAWVKMYLELMSRYANLDGVVALSYELARRFSDIWGMNSGKTLPSMVSFDDYAPETRTSVDLRSMRWDRVAIDYHSVATSAVRLLANRIQGSGVGAVRIVVKAELLLESDSVQSGCIKADIQTA